MPYLMITTKGEVAFENHIKLEEGYRYDITFDNLMLPYIPIADILREKGLITGDVKVGFAHPDGYFGLCFMTGQLIKSRPNIAACIKQQFTNDRPDKESGMRIRSIKAGIRFISHVLVPSDLREELGKRISGLNRIGVTAEGITGEVRLQLVNEKNINKGRNMLNSLAHYVSLDYSVTLLTPACFYAPYEDGEKTRLHIPGAVISDFVRRYPGKAEPAEAESIRCSNAYISDGRTRLLPVPACSSVVKLDKKQYRYRLAPGKDPSRVEQDVALQNAFAASFESNLLKYMTPETEHIAAKKGEMFDALSPGQTFCGRIYGSDRLIRTVVNYIANNPFAFFGKLSEDGYGEAFLSITGINEAGISAELPARFFDVCCVSDTLILNENGISSCSAEDLLSEIEYVLKCPGRLRIEGRYTNVYRDYSDNLRWGSDGAVVRCIGKGSVMRVRTIDDEPIDIFPLINCFVGERTRDGYGELLAYPARGQYYRLAQKLPVSLYEREYFLSFRDISIGAAFAREVIRSLLKSRIEALAIADRKEIKSGAVPEELIPEDILFEMKEQLLPDISKEELYEWYQKALEGR